MGFFTIWLFLLWPILMLSTDPQLPLDEIKASEQTKETLLQYNPKTIFTAKDIQTGDQVDDALNDVQSGRVELRRLEEEDLRTDAVSDVVQDSENVDDMVRAETSPEVTFLEESKTENERLGDEVSTEVKDNIASQQEETNKLPETEESPQVETVPGLATIAEESDFPQQRKDDAVVATEDENATAAGKAQEIPSFSEWTKKQQELLKKQDSNLLHTNGVVRDSKKEDGKNFASPDCGAKILLANPEAQNPSGTISSSHDEYMLNRCGVSSWLIMELCEPIRIDKIAIGNLELFSSSPKEIEVGISDRYPTREWIKIGPLELPDSRAVHPFPVNTNSTYSKFIRIQILSHHGHEHYCPLSVIRIYGKSEYEVLDPETTHSNEVGHADDNSALGEEPLNNEGTNEKSVIGTAADAVINIVKKAAQVLGKRELPKETQNNTNCQSVTRCALSKANVTEVCNNKLLQFVQANSYYFPKNASCRSLLNQKSIGTPNQVEGFWIALFGDGILHSLCSYKSPLKTCGDESDSVEDTVNALTANATLKSNLTIELSHTAPAQQLNQTFVPEVNSASEKPPVMEEESRIQKESVFVRLTNRIKALERNQSLSSGYLEELSQRFKKQSEESYSVVLNMKKTMNETLSKYKWMQEFSRRESSFLRRSVADLRVTLWRTEMQRGFLIFVVLIQFFGVGIFCCWTRRKIRHLEDEIALNQLSAPSASFARNVKSQIPITPRKRSNSHPDLMKLKKKKKKKDTAKNSENLFSFIPHSATSPDSVGFVKSSLPASPNGVLTSSNSTNLLNPQSAVPLPTYETDTENRFGILASPSTQTLNSVCSSTLSSNSNDGINSGSTNSWKKPDQKLATTSNKSGSSITSLDSAGSKGRRGSKKMKFKHFIPKLFDK